jgi:hypothetical protein
LFSSHIDLLLIPFAGNSKLHVFEFQVSSLASQFRTRKLLHVFPKKLALPLMNCHCSERNH